MRVIPGLLQSEEYARSVISAGKPRATPEAVDRSVSLRLARQEIFTRDDPPMLWSVVHEGALRHVIGSDPVMGEQLDKLIALARTPDVVIQVFPYTAYDHTGTDGPISVYDFTDAPSVAYAECNTGGMIVESPAGVAGLMTTISMIRAAALPAPGVRSRSQLSRKLTSSVPISHRPFRSSGTDSRFPSAAVGRILTRLFPELSGLDPGQRLQHVSHCQR